MCKVQSLAPVMPSGFGAKRPASSTLPVLTRRSEQFSHTQPPCISTDTITAGNATVGRSSTAQRMNVCVPPPLAPVTPIRLASTSGRSRMKSSARMLFQVCRPMKLCKRSSASASVKPSRWPMTLLSEWPTMSYWKTTQPMRASWVGSACSGWRAPAIVFSPAPSRIFVASFSPAS